MGSEVLGAVVNAACTGETTEKGARPYGKKLGARRLQFMADIRASLVDCFSGSFAEEEHFPASRGGEMVPLGEYLLL